MQYENAGSNVWSYVLSAPDTGSYIAMGFSSDGSMVGSSAMAGWIAGGGPGIAKRYYLGGLSSKRCPPDQGSLDPVQGKSLIMSQGSRLYLAFQLNGAQPPQRLIYAVGPQNNQPSSDGYLPRHRTMASGSIDLSGGSGGESSGEYVVKLRLQARISMHDSGHLLRYALHGLEKRLEDAVRYIMGCMILTDACIYILYDMYTLICMALINCMHETIKLINGSSDKFQG